MQISLLFPGLLTSPGELPNFPSPGTSLPPGFRKPQGCLNGDACLRCHLCPAGELKRRKGEQKAKRALAKSESSPEAEPEPLPLEPELPSLGSRLHAAGTSQAAAGDGPGGPGVQHPNRPVQALRMVLEGALVLKTGPEIEESRDREVGSKPKWRPFVPRATWKANKHVMSEIGEQMDADAPSRAAPSPAAVTVPAAPMVYQVLPQYPTLLSPWRPPCPGCACCTNCVPLNQPRQCVAYLSAMSPASLPAAPCEAGERRTVQELSAPVFAVPSVTFPKLVPAPQPTPGFGSRRAVITVENVGVVTCVLQRTPHEIKLRRKAKASKGNLNGAEEMTLHKAT
ncbi:unnamed protein product [Cladocopium goreaui]|uniref:Uncharacterized protein n=1 Tax=Cladocopium goreaui TaxID=2562237 RepID=A0A9P1CJW0_9DINO|nr:unnamed protein product [Cladocopium goreaui]